MENSEIIYDPLYNKQYEIPEFTPSDFSSI